jgi:hypothetical protein
MEDGWRRYENPVAAIARCSTALDGAALNDARQLGRVPAPDAARPRSPRRYVAFSSEGTNLVRGDTNDELDVCVRNVW